MGFPVVIPREMRIPKSNQTKSDCLALGSRFQTSIPLGPLDGKLSRGVGSRVGSPAAKFNPGLPEIVDSLNCRAGSGVQRTPGIVPRRQNFQVDLCPPPALRGRTAGHRECRPFYNNMRTAWLGGLTNPAWGAHIEVECRIGLEYEFPQNSWRRRHLPALKADDS